MQRWWETRRFDALEVALIALFAVAIAAIVTTVTVLQADAEKYAQLSHVAFSAAQEQVELKARYGPTRYSRNEEEWVIRDYFQDRRDGVFVDVGANHYRNDSNTLYLESVLGWSGVAVEPQAAFAADYRVHRPRTAFFSFFVSDTSDSDITLHLAEGNSLVASSSKEFAERGGIEGDGRARTTRAVRVPAIRLTDLLDRIGIARFDLLSVDVELAEPKVLAGFDISRFRPSLVCIEAHPQVRQQLLDYFAAHGYVLLGRYLRADLQNLYFAPVGDPLIH